MGCGRRALRADRLVSIIKSTFLILGGIGYPEYSSKKSKRVYSDHAKIGLLIVMEYLGKSFAEFSRLMGSLEGMMKAARISEIPDESTLRKFRKRLDTRILDKVMIFQSGMIVGNSRLTVSIDANGFSTSHASKYYVSRLKYFGTENTVIRGYTKVSLAVCTDTKTILTADVADSRNADVKRLEYVVEKLSYIDNKVDYVLADKGYDAEYAHRYIRGKLNAESLIPVRNNSPKKGDTAFRTIGVNRSRMKRLFKDPETKRMYGQRSQAETVNSMLKGVLGDVLDGRNIETRRSEVMFRCLAHNFRIGLELRNSGMRL